MAPPDSGLQTLPSPPPRTTEDIVREMIGAQALTMAHLQAQVETQAATIARLTALAETLPSLQIEITDLRAQLDALKSTE